MLVLASSAKKNLSKKYHAIVHGNFTETELTGLINQPIGKKGSGVKRAVVADGKKSTNTVSSS